MELTIACKTRPAGSKPNALRRQGLLPAVLYGHNGTESVALTLDKKSAELLVKKASLNNTLIQLDVTDMTWSGKALLREVQAHPWRGDLYHISFFSVGSHASIEVTVPVQVVGDAVGVKRDGGILEQVLTEIEVQCSPDRVPEAIEVNVSNLEIGDALHVSELILPEGVKVLGDADRVVVTISQPKQAVESVEAEAANV